MCNLSKGVEEKALARGLEKGILSSIKNLMDSMGWTVEQAMSALKISEADRLKYSELLKKVIRQYKVTLVDKSVKRVL